MAKSRVATALRFLMNEKGVTVSDLGSQTKINRQTLYSMLKKETNQVDLDNLKTLADYFNVEISVFLIKIIVKSF